LNRINATELPDGGLITYEYDVGPNALGRLSRISDSTGSTSWTYNNFGEVTTKTQTIGSIILATNYTYDAQGRLVVMTLPSGKVVRFSYNVHQVSGVSVDDVPVLSGATYEPFGAVNGWTWGDNSNSTREYNLRGLMSSYSLAGDTRALSYDAAGRLQSARDGSTEAGYGYDPVDRVVQFNAPAGTGDVTFGAPPVLLTTIQTMNNETGLVPGEPSMPWLTVATKNVTANDARVSLERAQVNTGSIEVKEKIGYVAIEAGTGFFLTSLEVPIYFEAQITPEFIQGWGTGCFETAFLNSYSVEPVVLASLHTRNGGDGGWLRRCSLNQTGLGLTVDEDKFGDPERRHPKSESAGLVAFSEAFDAQFMDDQGPWGMEVSSVTLPSTAAEPSFTRVNFRQVYATRPIVIVLPSADGGNPSSVRIRNVTQRGFEVAQVEPAPQDGGHVAMPIHYLAIERGTHTMPDGTRIVAGRKATMKQKHGSGVVGAEGWARIRFQNEVTSLPQQDYAYDGNGNRLSLTEDSTVYLYTYLANSNRLLSTSGPTPKSLTYDAAGNVVGDGSRSYRYDDRGRLVDVDFGTIRYQYNAQGQRVRKDDSQGAIIFAYGEGGELLGEYDEFGAPIREHVWFAGAPVAVLSGSGMYYVHTDHQGTPRVISDGNAVVWRWEFDPFGSTPVDDDPDGDSAPFVYNLRFPGHYFDSETGLHYNYFRTYDPSTGRYLESDPIGLLGGINTYGYALQNPLRYVDPFGLDSIFDDLIPDGGFPNELVCRQTLRAGCNTARAACQQLSCTYGSPTTCKIPCQNAAVQCKVDADEFCQGQDYGDEDDSPSEPERSYDAEGCYYDYRRTWYGKRNLEKICPGDKDYKGEECADE
jgi:RHS repeat-associated protein